MLQKSPRFKHFYFFFSVILHLCFVQILLLSASLMTDWLSLAHCAPAQRHTTG